MDYEKDIKIDPDALDVEWLEQPSLMLSYARYEASAERKLDIAKEQLDLVRADLDKEIRDKPDDFGINKLTETVIANTILSQERYAEAYDEYTTAKYEYNIARAAVRAFQQRKDALENLVRLHAQQWFAGPSMPRDLSKEARAKHEQEKLDSRVSRKLNKKTN